MRSQRMISILCQFLQDSIRRIFSTSFCRMVGSHFMGYFPLVLNSPQLRLLKCSHIFISNKTRMVLECTNMYKCSYTIMPGLPVKPPLD